MRFLLIAPGRDVPSLEALQGSDAAPGTLENQFDHRTHFLSHAHPDIAPQAAELAERLADVPVVVHDVRVHVALGYAMLVADVDLDLGPGRPGDEVESALTSVAHTLAVATQRAELAQIRWVGRYRIRADDEPLIAGWSGAGASRVALHSGGAATLETGWANGTIEGWDVLGAGERWDVIRGLVDAQALWCQLEDIHETSRIELRGLYLSPTQSRLSRKVAALTDLNAWFQVHNLCLGDLVSGTQGRRRDVALATLEVWKFDDLRERTAADLDAALTHTEALQRLGSQRYERAVEIVLLALTLVSTLGLVLSFISVAFINVPSVLPDDGSFDIPFISVFRDIDADAVLLASVVGLAIVVVALMLSRRRSAPGVGR